MPIPSSVPAAPRVSSLPPPATKPIDQQVEVNIEGFVAKVTLSSLFTALELNAEDQNFFRAHFVAANQGQLSRVLTKKLSGWQSDWYAKMFEFVIKEATR